MRGSRVAALCAVGGFLLLAVISARGSTAVPKAPQDVDPDIDSDPRSGGRGAAEPEPIPAEELDRAVEAPDVVGTASLVVVVLLVLAAFLVLVLQAFRRRGSREWVGIEDGEEEVDHALPDRLRRAAERARTQLTTRTGGPPGDAVVAAWLVLEDAAAREGAGREPHQTATEFTAALLGRHTTDEPALDQLRALYQRARFGPPGSVGEQDVDAARTALDRVLRGLHDAAPS